jgi:hypothetical protein
MDTELMLVLAFSFLTTLVIAVSIGAVILLKPIANQLGDYLKAKAAQGRLPPGPVEEDWNRLLDTVDSLDARLNAMEERQEFTEKLLSKPAEGRSPGTGV